MCVLISLALRLALALLAHLQLEAQTGDGEKSREIINYRHTLTALEEMACHFSAF